MDKRFFGILAALAIIFVGIFAITQSSNNKTSGSNSNTQPTSHIAGQGQKGVTLVEWGDYECPVCGEYNPIIEQVKQQFSKQIYFQFRNLPLTAIHPNAFAAARAAEAAGLQKQYFQMNLKLYDNQNEWAGVANPQSLFDTYAKQLGLNITQFDQDYASSKVNDAINADLAVFDKTGKEKATPTFFLDGVYLPNSQLVDPQTGQPSVTQFANVINAEIAKKNPSPTQ